MRRNAKQASAEKSKLQAFFAPRRDCLACWFIGQLSKRGVWYSLQEAADMVDQAQLEKDEAEREAQEVRRLMEIDADEEIEELKAR